MSNANKKLSLSIGDFIRYWGFRRVHGAIWTQIYLSKVPLNCSQLSKNLGLSKSLISPAIEELCEHKLIYEVPSPNEKTKLYTASQDIDSVIKHVLKKRESKMLKKIKENLIDFKKTSVDKKDISISRLNSLEKMIFSADVMLELLLIQDDIMNITKEFET